MKEILKACDKLVRIGRGAEALATLAKVNTAKLSPHHIPEFASLLRRAGDPYASTAILYTTVLKEQDTSATFWNQLQSEYGASLNAIGCTEQAQKVLRKVNPEAFPLAYLYRAFTHLSQWDYEGARPHLIKCFGAFKPKDLTSYSYWQLVAKVNLLACDVFERNTSEVEAGIKVLLAFTEKKPELRLLRATVYELVAQHSIELKFFQRAKDFLIKAASDLKDFEGNSKLFIRKWLAIVDLLADGLTEDTIGALVKVRMEAEKKRHWETLRSLDLHEAIASKNEEQFLRVVYGTPFPSYRKRILGDFPGPLVLPPTVYVCLKRKVSPICYIDLLDGSVAKIDSSGELIKRRNVFDPEGLETEILRFLSADIYRPTTLSLLYNKLHPNMSYQPGRGDIVKSMVKTTQQLLDQHKIPLKILLSKGFASLSSDKGVAFATPTGETLAQAA